MGRLPAPGTREWVELSVYYLGTTCAALEAAGVAVAASWTDPVEPRDATIVLGGEPALGLVWDEVSGWRYGSFVSGRKGVRTVLGGERSFGGELLPEPTLVAAAMQCVLAGNAIGTPARPYFRSYTDLGDGTDERLVAFARQAALA